MFRDSSTFGLLELTADWPETCKRCGYISSNDLCVSSVHVIGEAQTDGPESLRSAAGSRIWARPPSTREFLLDRNIVLMQQKDSYSPDGKAPEGQRTIPKYVRKLRVAEGTEGIERPMAKVEITAE